MATAGDLLAILEDLLEEEFKKFKWYLQIPEELKESQGISRSKLETADRMTTVTEVRETYDKRAVAVVIKVLKLLKKNNLVQCLLDIDSTSKEFLAACQGKLKSNLLKKFQHLYEQPPRVGTQMMNEIYIEPEIIEEKFEEVDQEKGDTEAPPIRNVHEKESLSITGLFEPKPRQPLQLKTLLIKGVSGIGKTVLTRKFALDWAKDKVLNDIQFLFLFTFQELNSLKERKYSWVELLHHFFPEIKGVETVGLEKLQIAFVFDGLDECQLRLDFHHNEILTDITEPASVDVLLTNIITGNLFPSAHILITTTPEAAGQIPPMSIDMVTQVRGFSNPKKEEYFRKRLMDKDLAFRIITHIKASRRLHVMCQIPMFCWITATVLEDMLKTSERVDLPKTVTEMYSHFLVVPFKGANDGTETELQWIRDNSKIILSFGKLALEHLDKRNLIFSETNLTECGINIGDSDVVSNIFKEDVGVTQVKSFRFVHFSLQSFLAALYVIASPASCVAKLLSQKQSTSEESAGVSDQSEEDHLLHAAVDKALRSPNAHMDLFLRFLLGLSLSTNQDLLRNLQQHTGCNLQSNQETVEYIKKKIRESSSPEQCFNLFHCLNEMNDSSLVEEIQRYLSSGMLSLKPLDPAQWSTLLFILMCSEMKLDTFELKKYSASEDALLHLLPLVQTSRLSLLDDCELSIKSCKALATVLSKPDCNIRELDLSENNVSRDIRELASGLKNQHCKVETLRLRGCCLESGDCEVLSSVLSCNTSSLRELDLTENRNLKTQGIQKLSVGLTSPACRLDSLRLISCGLTWISCDDVAFFLSSQFSCVRQLDLSMNRLEDHGVDVFSTGLQSPHCKLETLSLRFCELRSCDVLASVLTSQTSTSSLKVLDLSHNFIRDSGVKFLFEALQNDRCKLEALRLSHCWLTEDSCAALATALSSETSCLKELDLSGNDLQKSGVTSLSAGLQSPQCILETLRLSGCLVTAEGCESLASALSSNPSHLKELDLSYNHPGDLGVQLLSAGLQNPDWRLETLNLDHCSEQRLKPGLEKYVCEIRLDPNTAHRNLVLSENDTQVTFQEREEKYRYHPERFHSTTQLLCSNGLTGRCYLKIQFDDCEERSIHVAVAYKSIPRRGDPSACRFGANTKSRVLFTCDDKMYGSSKKYKGKTFLYFGMYLDWSAGILSLCGLNSRPRINYHTSYNKFTGPVYPGFGFDAGTVPNKVNTCVALRSTQNMDSEEKS